MRWLLLYIALIAVNVNSQEVGHDASAIQKTQKAEQKKADVRFDTSSLEKTIRESIKDASEKPDAHADEKLKIDRQIGEYTGQLSAYTEKLAIYTKDLSRFTLGLFIATLLVALIAIWQGIQLKRTVDASVIESQPVLSPKITHMEKLHPVIRAGDSLVFNHPETHRSVLFFVFENFGKTPGMIRRVQADLYLTENDKLPEVDWNKLPDHHYLETIPGESRAKDWSGPHVDFRKDIVFTSKELNELWGESDPDKLYRRFFFAGIVIYDDFFGMRHTRRFCLKLRMTTTIQFQAQHGGTAYNHIEREKIPTLNPWEAAS